MSAIPEPKPTLLLVPHYIGSLRYFEKLYPFLKEKYTIVFLLIELKPKTSATYTASHFNFDEMTTYCETNGYAFTAFRQPRLPFGFTFPYLQFLLSTRTYDRFIAHLLGDPAIKHIVAVHDGGFYLRQLFLEANKRGISAGVLQWALTYGGQVTAAASSQPQWRQLLFKIRRPIKNFLKDFFLRLIAGSEASNSKTILGAGVSKKFGVINQQAYDYFISKEVPETKMSVVGYLDFYLAEQTKKTLDQDPVEREATAKKLGLDLSKKQIVIYTSAYNSNVVHELDDAGQLALYDDIVSMIQSACPPERYQILLKIHPIEDISLYRPLEKRGVILFGKYTRNFDLVYFSDLYIADSSTSNFIPMVMNKQTLFFNFLQLPIIDTSREYFGIKKYITDRREFHDRLLDYARGTLERQYKDTDAIITRDSLAKILNWIG